MEIEGKKILITGANRGIGRAAAHMFAEDKAHLFLANRTLDESLAEELLSAGAASVQQIHADLGSRSGVDAFVKDHQNLEIDILFNNAGQLTGGLLEEQSIDEIHAMLQVNVNALIQITHGFLPGMIRRGQGKIINHSSVASYMHFPGASTYAASKAAVTAFTQCLHAELAGTGVTTLLLLTPGVETRMFNEISKRYGRVLDLTFLKSIPAKQYVGMIREAILEDLSVLKPHGATGLSLRLAQHAPGAFQAVMARTFKRK
jgi:hypothetical protein